MSLALHTQHASLRTKRCPAHTRPLLSCNSSHASAAQRQHAHTACYIHPVRALPPPIKSLDCAPIRGHAGSQSNSPHLTAAPVSPLHAHCRSPRRRRHRRSRYAPRRPRPSCRRVRSAGGSRRSERHSGRHTSSCSQKSNSLSPPPHWVVRHSPLDSAPSPPFPRRSAPRRCGRNPRRNRALSAASSRNPAPNSHRDKRTCRYGRRRCLSSQASNCAARTRHQSSRDRRSRACRSRNGRGASRARRRRSAYCNPHHCSRWRTCTSHRGRRLQQGRAGW